jgi:hypothetical protein
MHHVYQLYISECSLNQDLSIGRKIMKSTSKFIKIENILETPYRRKMFLEIRFEIQQSIMCVEDSKPTRNIKKWLDIINCEKKLLFTLKNL